MQQLILVLVASRLYFPVPIDADAILTWYGEGFIGQRHAASWHRETPNGFPEVVTLDDYGVAAPASIPFGTLVRLAVYETCWGDPIQPRSVVAIVVDRRARSLNGYWDAWPATFNALAEEDAGCLRVTAERLMPVDW